MARKVKIGLDYFPHNCDHDDELKYIIALHKETGYYIYFRLLERIYKNLGYYIDWEKKNIALFSNEINIDISKINIIINDCFEEKLFSKSLYTKYNIITSKGIQERYLEAIDRRKEAYLIKDYILLKNDYINKINVNINWLNVDISTQSKVKETKEDYKKVLLSELKHSDFVEKEYLDITIAFWELFTNNLKEKDIPTSKIEKANGKWIDSIRLLIETDKYKLEDLREVFKFLQVNEFWKKNILSTSKLREKFEKLLLNARKNGAEGITKEGCTARELADVIGKHFATD